MTATTLHAGDKINGVRSSPTVDRLTTPQCFHHFYGDENNHHIDNDYRASFTALTTKSLLTIFAMVMMMVTSKLQAPHNNHK